MRYTYIQKVTIDEIIFLNRSLSLTWAWNKVKYENKVVENSREIVPVTTGGRHKRRGRDGGQPERAELEGA
jgi:hypothetical protein